MLFQWIDVPVPLGARTPVVLSACVVCTSTRDLAYLPRRLYKRASRRGVRQYLEHIKREDALCSGAGPLDPGDQREIMKNRRSCRASLVSCPFAVGRQSITSMGNYGAERSSRGAITMR